MKKFTKIVLLGGLIILSGILSNVSAQHLACDGVRYIDNCFNDIRYDKNIVYSSNYTLLNELVDLKMDVYYSPTDTISKRALMILLYGGGYLLGVAGKEFSREFALHLARKGYIVAAMDYRLIDIPMGDTLVMHHNCIKTVVDTKAAIRFFIDDARNENTFRIDTTNIFLAGISAGTWTVNLLAYLHEDDPIPEHIMEYIQQEDTFYDLSNDVTFNKSWIKGVLCLSGAIFYSGWLSEDDPPIYIVHETGDPLVPCTYGTCPSFDFPFYMHGGCDIKHEADEVGLYNDSFFIQQSTHYEYSFSSALLSGITHFFQGLICENQTNSIENQNRINTLQIKPNPAKNELTLTSDNIISIRIYNSFGILVYQGLINGESRIDISGYEPGVYYIRYGKSNNCQKLVVI